MAKPGRPLSASAVALAMEVSDSLSRALSAGSLVALQLYPVAVGACCGAKQQRVKRPFGNALAFVLGIAVAVALLGLLAVYIGRVAVMATPVRYLIAFLPILVGVYRLGWIQLPRIALKTFQPSVGGAFGT